MLRASSGTRLGLHVRDLIMKKTRVLPSRSSRLGRIRKAAATGAEPQSSSKVSDSERSTARSLENQVNSLFCCHFCFGPPTTNFNTHTHVHTAEQPHWTLDCLLTLFCIFPPPFCQYFSPTSCAWSNSNALHILPDIVEALPSLKLCSLPIHSSLSYCMCASVSLSTQ